MTPYDGPDRRSPDARIAVLESSYAALKESQVAIHKRITDFKKESKEDLRLGFADLKAVITAAAEDRKKKEELIDGRLKGLENWRNWLTGAYVTAAALVSAWIGTQGKVAK